MNAFSEYNQIKMHISDQECILFTIDRETYCYQVMPFSLKNAGATYQRFVNLMFLKQIGHNVEVYVDDLLVKTQELVNHVTNLAEAFDLGHIRCA